MQYAMLHAAELMLMTACKAYGPAEAQDGADLGVKVASATVFKLWPR